MPPFALTATLPSPQAVVMPRLLTVLRGYAERDDFALSVEIGLAQAAMSVPVQLAILDGRTASAVPITMRARRHTDWFPVFGGEIRIEEQGPLASAMRLEGTYEVPLGAVGTIVNQRVLGGAAERSLRAFGERLRADVLDEVRRSELAIRQAEGRGTA